MLCVQMRPAATNVARLYMCLCICKHTSWQCNSGWTDRHAVWWIYSGGPRNHVLDGGGPHFLTRRGILEGICACSTMDSSIYGARRRLGQDTPTQRCASCQFTLDTCYAASGLLLHMSHVAWSVTVFEKTCATTQKNVKIFTFFWILIKKRKKRTLRTVPETA